MHHFHKLFKILQTDLRKLLFNMLTVRFSQIKTS